MASRKPLHTIVDLPTTRFRLEEPFRLRGRWSGRTVSRRAERSAGVSRLAAAGRDRSAWPRRDAPANPGAARRPSDAPATAEVASVLCGPSSPTQICARRFQKTAALRRDHEKLIDSIPTTMVIKMSTAARTFLLRARSLRPPRRESRAGLPAVWPPRQARGRIASTGPLGDRSANPLTPAWP